MKDNTTTISHTNQKGQLVIPKDIRDRLEIDDTVDLLIKLMGNSIIISPIDTIIASSDQECSFLDVLEQTKGSWKTAKPPEKRNLELEAAKKRRKSW